MPRSLKYAWRTLATAGGAAMLMLAMPAAGNAQSLQQTPINICISGRGFINGINVVHCRPNEIALQWNFAGPQGAPGATGAQGAQGVAGAPGVVGAQGATGAAGVAGPAGVTGPTGLTGPTGPTGALGNPGVAGATGATGPTGIPGLLGVQGAVGPIGPVGPMGIVGPTGLIGLQGLQGLTGAQGPVGLAGPQGAPGTAGDQTSILHGGTLGKTIGAADGIQFTGALSALPLFMGPGDGASSFDITSQNSVSVPVPAGTLSNLQVVLDHNPGATASGDAYTITVCDNSVCGGPVCTISEISTACTAPGTQTYADGDTMSLKVTAVTGTEATANASWSANYTITAP